MVKKIIEMGFLWNGMTADVEDAIHKCGVCYSIKNAQTLSKRPKIIITYGPCKRYEADIWYLSDDLKKGHNYLYVLDIIDHYSKWLYSFLLKNKTADLVLTKIKLFININCSCEIFQTDNGGEFINVELKVYLENLGILHLRSTRYHPQTNGCCEAVHKEIREFLFNKLSTQKDNFDIEIELANAID